MPRTFDPARTCLHVRDWPTADQSLWAAALADSDFEDDTQGRGTVWRPTTMETNRQGYGRWINYLKRSGADMTVAPADRVTPDRVTAYRKELTGQGLKPQTCANRIAELMSVMLAFAPLRDWNWLRRRFNRLCVIADDERRQEPVTMLTGDILDKAFKALDAAQANGLAPRLAPALDYRNWLMVAMLSLTALRRDNFSNLSITRHLQRNRNIWTIKISAAEAKTHKPIDMPVPEVLHQHIQYYLDHVRPTLLAGRASDRLWISVHHTNMTGHSVYISMTNFTRKVFGEAINPHRYRHIGATSTVIAAPEMLEAARAFLGHGDSETTKDFYIIGGSFVASRQQDKLVAALRDRLPIGLAARAS